MIGPYKVLDLVGHGGMSTVYKALQTDLDRVVAIKVLLPALASDPSFRQRFAREARLVASLRHPNIVAIYGVGENDGPPYIVMEYLDGPTLNALIRQRRETGDVFSVAETLAFVRPLCNALDYAHDQQIVHRDLKPENIICTAHGPVITDFGVAKSLQEAVTDMSIVIGTPAYMAPEQINGEGADRRTDVYALGVLLYELLTGHVPFTGPTPTSVTQAHLQQTPPSFATLNPYVKVAAGLEQVAQRALAKRPEDRWDSAGALYAALLGATSPTVQIPVPPRPVQRVVPVKPPSASNPQWGRLALLIPLLALLIGGLVAARVWGQSGEDGSDPRIAIRRNGNERRRSGGNGDNRDNRAHQHPK
jgi:serine/threonine-protein kinase